MPPCPTCLGAGGIDQRDSNAWFQEHLTESELALVSGLDVDWYDCEECEATGVVSEERLADILAASRAQIDQAFAKLKAEGRLPA